MAQFARAWARQLRGRTLGTIRSAVRAVRSGGSEPDAAALILRWWRGAENWGDALNPVLVGLLSGKAVVPADQTWNLTGQPIYSVIGSLLDDAAEPNLVVWGSGFMHESGRMDLPPQSVHAVRGPLSRRNLLAQGIACPETFGDPALLYPDFRKRAPVVPGRVGLIPHFVDRGSEVVRRVADALDARVIDICGGVDDVADAVGSCEWVLSSSLHGLILADAYGVANTWVRISDKVLGGSFKFHDYFLGVGRPLVAPALLTPHTSRQALETAAFRGAIAFDREGLLNACPFLG